MKKSTFLIFLLIIFCGCKLNKTPGKWSIITNENKVIIKAGILERLIMFSKNEASTVSISVDGKEMLARSGEFLATISQASPNIEPVGISKSLETGIIQNDTENNNTDALVVKKNDFQGQEPVQWIRSVEVSGKGSRIIEGVNHSIDITEKGRTRLVIDYTLDHKEWPGISVNVIYEVYNDYPVIRKWIEFTNKGKLWVKIENLEIDDLQITKPFLNQTFLTPDSRGINSSIVAFSDLTASCGIISASEIPSKLRSISGEGSTGYNTDYFEWVLGPTESFISEPVFMYGFSDESYSTLSGVSTALDRAVEGDFQTFLNEHIIRPVGEDKSVAPVFCTWTNYNSNINDEKIREAAKIASDIGFKCFQLDAGWSETGVDGGWAISTPNPDLQKFPDLKDLNQFIQSKKMKAGLWYSVFIDEPVQLNTEERLLYSLPLIKRAGGVGLSFCFKKSREKYLNDIVYLHDIYQASYFKQDLSNICYGDIAQGHESRTLKESYLRGLRGLFETQDEIHARAPNVWLQLSHEIYWETPGPEADIAVLKHADSYHTAPNEYWGAGNRKELVNSSWDFDVKELQNKLIEGAFRARNLWYSHRGLPLDRIEVFGAVSTNFKGSLSSEILDRQICSWLMGAPISFSGDLTSLTKENIDQYKSRFTMIEMLEKKYGIYSHFQYSGVPGPTDEGWHWWGKLNPQGCGAVVVLRGSNGEDTMNINIPWVQPESKYRVKSLFVNKEMGFFTGKQLQDGDLQLTLSRFDQEIVEISLYEN